MSQQDDDSDAIALHCNGLPVIPWALIIASHTKLWSNHNMGLLPEGSGFCMPLATPTSHVAEMGQHGAGEYAICPLKKSAKDVKKTVQSVAACTVLCVDLTGH